GDVIAEDGRASRTGAGGGEGFGKIVAVKKVVAEHKGGGLAAGEEAGVSRDVEGLREAVGAGLLGVGKFQAEAGSVAEEFSEQREIGRGGDDKNLPDTGEHEHGKRIIDHRLVVDWHELLAH